MPDDQSDDVQSAINQALPPEYRQAIADNMQVAAETRAAKTPKPVSAAPTPTMSTPAQPVAMPPTPTPAAVTLPPELAVPTPTPPVPTPEPPRVVQPPVAVAPQPRPQPPAPKPVPPKSTPLPQSQPPKAPEPEAGPAKAQPKDLNDFVSQIEGELIPQTLDMLLDNYSANRDKIHENLRLALWRLGELEMVSSPQDLLHREAIGELAGKLKMLELWAGRLDQRS